MNSKLQKNLIDVSNHSLLYLVISVELLVAPRISESLANFPNMLNPFSTNVRLLYSLKPSGNRRFSPEVLVENGLTVQKQTRKLEREN